MIEKANGKIKIERERKWKRTETKFTEVKNKIKIKQQIQTLLKAIKRVCRAKSSRKRSDD